MIPSIRTKIKENILSILDNMSCGVGDEMGGVNIGVFNDSFEETAEAIIKMIEEAHNIIEIEVDG